MTRTTSIAIPLAFLLILNIMACGAGDVTIQSGHLVAISVTPSNPLIAKNSSQQFVATGIYSNHTTQDITAAAVWTTSDTAVAVISNAANSKGLASSSATGSITVTATYEGISGSTTATITSATLVSISVTPANPSIAKGSGRQFTATAIYSDNSTQDLTASATWSSSNAAVATVSNTAGTKGAAAALTVGTATISAASGSISGSTAVTVTPATLTSIVIAPGNPSIARGTNQQFTATGTYSDNSTQNLTDIVAWYSSTTAVATISNAAGSKGLATSASTGATTITASSGTVSGTTTLTVTPATLVSISVTPANPSIARGTSRQFTATGRYADNSTQDLTASATWSSSNAAVATVSNAAGSKGSASALTAGTATISAASGTISGSTTLTVTSATLASITVTPANPSIAQGATQQFTATGTYSDTSTQDLTAAATWSSSNTAVASVSNAAGSNGLATAVASGSATISAISGSVSGMATITVPTAVSGGATLSWDDPTTNTDGSTLTGLAGCKIYYGTSPGVYSAIIDAGNVTTYVINNLAPGTYYFAVTAYDASGNESGYSNEMSKIIQ